jgi:tetratricopeptide (TPR) repeat protein
MYKLLMTFRPAQCPTCGGSLQLPDDHATVRCLYCGGTVIVREAIQAAAAASIPNLLKLARTAAESLNHQQAYDYFSRVLELDGENSRAWAGKAEAAGWLSRLPEMIKCFGNAIDVATPESRDVVQKSAAAVIARVTTQNFYSMRAQLSPAFADGEAWGLYLSGVGNTLKALESAHELIPNSTHILQAILYVCDWNPEKLSYVHRTSGQKYWRSLPPDWKNTIREKKQIYSEEFYALNPSARPVAVISKGASDILTRGQLALVAVGVLVVLIFLAALVVNQNNGGTTTSQTETMGRFPGTAAEKAYLEASGRYLSVHFEKCKSASVTMAGASDGTSTLNDIRTALQESRSSINKSWETDFLLVSGRNVPQKFTDVDKKLRRVHALQEDAFLELLRYWEDGRLSHITNGSTMFKQALLECDSAIKDLSKILDLFSPITQPNMNKG